MYSRKSIGPRRGARRTQVFTGYSCNDVFSRIMQSCLLLRKDKITPDI